MNEESDEAPRRHWLRAAFLGLVAGGLVIGLRYASLPLLDVGRVFEFVELELFDSFIKDRAARNTDRDDPEDPSQHIVIVGLTEKDIENPDFWDYPIPDADLAALLTKICEGEPAAVGVDILRNLMVPKDGSQIDELERVLLEHDEIIMSMSLSGGKGGIPPPSVLDGNPTRVGTIDINRDIGLNPSVRRGTLHENADGEDPYYSLAFLIAERFLGANGIAVGATPEKPGEMVIGDSPLPRFRSGHGAYGKQDDSGYQFLMSFPRDRDYREISTAEVMDPSFEATELEGKIILLGVTAESVSDAYPSSLKFQHRGIDLHAQMVEQLLNMGINGKKAMRVLPESLENVAILAVSIMSALSVLIFWRFHLNLLVVLLATWGVFPGGRALFHSNLWIPSVALALAVLLGGAFVILSQYFEARWERNVVRRLFYQHLNPKFARAIWNGRRSLLEKGRLRPQQVTATVIMTDMENYSGRSMELRERGNPNREFDWLDRYLGILTECIAARGGAVKDFGGDSVHAVFGVPVGKGTAGHAWNAVSSALAIDEELARLNRDFKSDGLPETRTRIGIATGQLTAGSIGTAHLLRFEIIGEPVILASRLESFRSEKEAGDQEALSHHHCRILVDETTLNGVKEYAQDRNIDSRSLGLNELIPGKKTDVYEILPNTEPNPET